jgi:hypothetical protein
MKNSFQEMFDEILREKLFKYLHKTRFQNQPPEYIKKIASQIVSEKAFEIDEFLQNHDVSLDNIQQMTDVVFKRIVLPHAMERKM